MNFLEGGGWTRNPPLATPLTNSEINNSQD